MPPRVCGCHATAAMWLSPCSSVDCTMRAIVSTATMGCSPTLVSPDSITASAPSSTALATSLASARVGAGELIIDSSIWVATMTGFALRRALSMMSFWWIGTSSSGHSTPRSPRATMMPSKASTISSMLSIAWGFSILAMIGTKMPSSRITARTSSASPAWRTKLSAMKSTPRLQRPAQVLGVLLRQRRDGHGDAGQVDALVVGDLAGHDDLGDDVGVVDRDDLQPDLAVVDQERVAGLHVAGQTLVGRPADVDGRPRRRGW